MSIISPMRNPMRGAIGLEASGPGYTAGEQITNNDFETGDFTGWTRVVSSPSGYTHINGEYGVDTPNSGWPSSSLPGVPNTSTRFVTCDNDNSFQATPGYMHQTFACPEGVAFSMDILGSNSFGTSPDYCIVEAEFQDGGGSPITRIFRNSLLTEIEPTRPYIRKLDNGFINSSGNWTQNFSSFSYACYYDPNDKTKIMLRRQATNDWAFITATGGWDVDDLTYGVAVGAYTLDDNSTVGSDNFSNIFFPQHNEGSNADFRRYSDGWMAGVHFFGVSSRTGYSCSVAGPDLVTPVGTVNCYIEAVNSRGATSMDSCSFVLI